MKLRLALAVLAVAVLGACSRQGDVAVVFKGHTPTNGKIKDDRSIEFRCPACGKLLPSGSETTCPDKKCGAKISWQREDRGCGYCNGSGKCTACVLMNQNKGECYNCRGHGYLTIQGRTPECPSCKGKKTCPACKGSGKCDFCQEGKVSLNDLKSRMSKPSDGESPK